MIKSADNPRRALGKGLTSLLPAKRVIAPEPPPSPAGNLPSQEFQRIPVDKIDPNPLQARTVFQAQRLQELAESIKTSGIIQPLVVRPKEGRYQLVAGERRWRAAKLAGIAEVPAVVREVPDDQLLELTLVENLQRENLNPLETANAFNRLATELGLSHEEIGRRTGKDRTTITNTLRLLRLPSDLQQLVAEYKLSTGHARTILSLPTDDLQRSVAEKSISQGLSVRQVERLVQRMTETREPKPVEEALEDPNVKAAIQEMQQALGTRVRIVEKANHRGRIEIDYYSAEDLDRIYSRIVGDSTEGN
jgi:ParB family chromosome partitioning protein